MSSAHDSPSNPQSKSWLYIVPTPIGNLKDITLRALEVLKGADVIACEDTRTSGKLLKHYDIHTKLVSYHEHNGEQMRPKLLARLAEGETIALISDAGTPLISDPGYKLVQAVQEAGYSVIPLPGACAATTALCASGLPSDHFCFIGFLPAKDNASRSVLQAFAHVPATLIFYEAARRVSERLQLMQEVLGAREVVLARELTKHFEEVLRLPMAEMIVNLKARDSIKGEVVLLVAPPGKQVLDEAQLDGLLREALEQMGTKQAAAQVAEQTGASKTELYQRALALKS